MYRETQFAREPSESIPARSDRAATTGAIASCTKRTRAVDFNSIFESRFLARPPCRYFSKNVHGYRHRPRYVVLLQPKCQLARHITSRYDSTRSTCRASRDERVEPCCSTNSTQPKCMGTTCRTCRVVSCRDVTTQWNLGFIQQKLCIVQYRYGSLSAVLKCNE